MPKEPRISALSICKNIPNAEGILEEKFSAEEWRIYKKIFSKNANLKSSSIGRVFDAVASLVGICDFQTFEGEAAMRLENLALEYFKENGLGFQASYFSRLIDNDKIPTKEIIQDLVEEIRFGKTRSYIAAKFHYSLVLVIEAVAKQRGVQKIALSGGVFQNSILVDLLLHHLGDKFELFFHKALSPNDENISFGQLVYFHIQQLSTNK